MAVYLGSTKVGTTIVDRPLGIPLEVKNGVLSKPTSSFTWESRGSDVNSYGLQDVFMYCTGLTSVDLSSLANLSGYQAMYNTFSHCTGLSSVNLSNLTTVSGTYAMLSAFSNTNLTSVDLSSLTTISGQSAMNSAFDGCRGLTSVDLSSLTTLSSSSAMLYAFQDCRNLKTLSFPALTSTSFGSYTNQFNYMLSGVTGCTVHFPSNLQSVIGSWTSVTSGFGGTNTTVLFDLPATT